MSERRIALVTGASRGIGRAIARKFSALGHSVVACGRDEAALEALVAEDEGVFPLSFDVSSEIGVRDAIERVRSRFGRLDILVNAAGVSGRMPSDAPEAPAHFQRLLATNLTGAFALTSGLLPFMAAGGRIVMVSSVMGKVGVPAYAAYCASKHGLIGLTRALALELAPRRITVNALCPGWVETEMADQAMAEIGGYLGLPPEAVREDEALAIPLGRFARPDEVAALAAYLISEDAALVTGQALNICGGTAAF